METVTVEKGLLGSLAEKIRKHGKTAVMAAVAGAMLVSAVGPSVANMYHAAHVDKPTVQAQYENYQSVAQALSRDTAPEWQKHLAEYANEFASMAKEYGLHFGKDVSSVEAQMMTDAMAVRYALAKMSAENLDQDQMMQEFHVDKKQAFMEFRQKADMEMARIYGKVWTDQPIESRLSAISPNLDDVENMMGSTIKGNLAVSVAMMIKPFVNGEEAAKMDQWIKDMTGTPAERAAVSFKQDVIKELGQQQESGRDTAMKTGPGMNI